MPEKLEQYNKVIEVSLLRDFCSVKHGPGILGRHFTTHESYSFALH